MVKRTFGYTLIEILIVLAIMGIAFTMGYVGFREFVRKQTITTLANEIRADLSLAQEQAISGKKPTGCVGYLRGYAFGVDSSTDYSIKAVCDSDVVVKQRDISQLNISLTNPNPNPILFKALGQGTNIGSGSSAVIQITQNTTNSYQLITIGSHGQIN